MVGLGATGPCGPGNRHIFHLNYTSSTLKQREYCETLTTCHLGQNNFGPKIAGYEGLADYNKALNLLANSKPDSLNYFGKEPYLNLTAHKFTAKRHLVGSE